MSRTVSMCFPTPQLPGFALAAFSLRTTYAACRTKGCGTRWRQAWSPSVTPATICCWYSSWQEYTSSVPSAQPTRTLLASSAANALQLSVCTITNKRQLSKGCVPWLVGVVLSSPQHSPVLSYPRPTCALGTLLLLLSLRLLLLLRRRRRRRRLQVVLVEVLVAPDPCVLAMGHDEPCAPMSHVVPRRKA